MARAPNKTALQKRMAAESPAPTASTQVPALVEDPLKDGHEPLSVSGDYRHRLCLIAQQDPNHALSAAENEIMQARALKGQAQRESIARAIYALRVADAQAVVQAIAMCVSLPAWIGVALYCVGVV